MYTKATLLNNSKENTAKQQGNDDGRALLLVSIFMDYWNYYFWTF